MAKRHKTDTLFQGWRLVLLDGGGVGPFCYAVNEATGEDRPIDNKASEGLSAFSFACHVALGFPPSPRNRPWTEAEIQKEAFPIFCEAMGAAA